MPDTLYIRGLLAQCRIGVFEWEQANPQALWIDLELEIDAAKAARRDDVAEAIDYGTIVTRVKGLVQERPYHLLETMAEKIAVFILAQFATSKVLVRVTKRALPGIESAAVEVLRQR